MVQLGDKVKCRLTGLTGVVVSKSEHLFGCKHVSVQPQELKDGKPVDGTWMDEGRVDVVEAGAVARPATAAVREGGPMLGTPPPAM